MKYSVKNWMIIVVVLLAFSSLSVQAQEISANHSSMKVTPEVSSVAPGQVFTLALHVTLNSHWHNYWVNPGDAGKGAKVYKWQSPEGVTTGDIQYPTPHVVPFGDMTTYAYKSENTHLLDVTIPADFSGDNVHLNAKVSWLVCDDRSCVPERGILDLSLPIGEGAIDDNVKALFADARAELPVKQDWPAAYHIAGDYVIFEIAFPELNAQEIYLFPEATKLTNAGAGQTALVEDGLLTVTAAKGSKAEKREKSALVVTFKDSTGEQQSVEVDASLAAASGTIVAAKIEAPSAVDSNVSVEELSFFSALIAAFIGGLILNLMPCVLPVLSLKMLSLVQMAEKHPRWVRESGAFYTIGVMGSFALMALVIIALKMTGESIGWGFQMQNPIVLLTLILLMVLIGLNLLGAFEFGAGLMNMGAEKTEGNSNKSSFWTGVLAVVVATPCTAPFMAGALGYAFVQSWYVSLLIFLSLGFGLAFPYLMVALVPSARRFVPNPGPWMSVFKSALAFPMFGTAIWLIWVLGDKDTMMWALASALTLAIAAWAWGMAPMSFKPGMWKTVAIGFFVLMIVFPVQRTLEAKDSASEARKAGITAGGSHAGEAVYSEGLLMEKLDEGSPVFAYFTADWCITCKANEIGSLHTNEVQQYFVSHNIAVMVGDYTGYDDSITQVLALYKRVGVPLYLYFEPGDSVIDAKVLPQTLLSPDSLLSEIR